ncbi:hypothetical protein DE146DRAFT_514925 [Phaeosphaeria sp. MPI-PUGE-AT-0046c]|nr:hypothetical protein DE146DRAFT_514925 [Phaeosphaeria sp. MPI-PUGE-AT-0046c]
MDSIFAQAAYAEDQTNAHSILYLHVMRASAMSFTFLSLVQFPFDAARARYQQTPADLTTLLTRTFRSSGRAFVIGTAAGALATWGRMRGMAEVEWQDRAWRILNNKGEMQTDWTTAGGLGAGAVVGVAAARRGALALSTGNAILGGAGVGSSIGIPFMISTFARGRKPA